MAAETATGLNGRRLERSHHQRQTPKVARRHRRRRRECRPTRNGPGVLRAVNEVGAVVAGGAVVDGAEAAEVEAGVATAVEVEDEDFRAGADFLEVEAGEVLIAAATRGEGEAVTATTRPRAVAARRLRQCLPRLPTGSSPPTLSGRCLPRAAAAASWSSPRLAGPRSTPAAKPFPPWSAWISVTTPSSDSGESVQA